MVNSSRRSPVEADEKFWIESKKKDGTTECYFDYDGCKNFLEHRGYWRWETLNHEYEFVYVADNIVETVKPHQIADFVKAFAKDTLQKGVRQMLYKGTAQYFGQVSLSMLDYFTGKFDVPQRGIERLFFRNTIWEVNAGISRKNHTPSSVITSGHPRRRTTRSASFRNSSGSAMRMTSGATKSPKRAGSAISSCSWRTPRTSLGGNLNLRSRTSLRMHSISSASCPLSAISSHR